MQPVISGNTITGVINGLALDVYGKVVPSITGNTIDKNANGIYVDYSDVNGNGGFSLSGNTITNNTGYGISINSYAKPVIHGNDIYGNGSYALQNNTSYEVDAKNNWWGAAGKAAIETGPNPKNISFIYDKYDSSSLGLVNYAGWLTASAMLTDGVCGPSNNGTFTTAPPVGLCSTGTPSVLAATGAGWNWSCAGQNGGSAAACSAQIQSYPLTVSFSGTGSGSVNGDLSCVAGNTCTFQLNYGAPVTLTAIADSSSTFGGWSGACAGTGNCSFTMNAATNLAAGFVAAPKAMVAGKGFSSVQAAYDDAVTTSGAVIKLLEGTLTGSFIAGREIIVHLQGGYNASYSTVSTETILSGAVKLRSGTVIMKDVHVK